MSTTDSTIMKNKNRYVNRWIHVDHFVLSPSISPHVKKIVDRKNMSFVVLYEDADSAKQQVANEKRSIRWAGFQDTKAVAVDLTAYGQLREGRCPLKFQGCTSLPLTPGQWEPSPEPDFQLSS
jgi:hypothetical protein